MIPDLGGLTPDVLRDLTNVGTVRRAEREVEQGTVEVTFVETDAGLEATAPDASCLLGAGSFDAWRCDCAAGGGCRHVVRAVLAWRARTPSSRGRGGSPAENDGLAPRPEGGDSGVDARTGAAAARARAAYGLVASVQRGERTTVVLHVPAEATVRLGADADPRFARCDCGRTGCVHLDHALVAVAAAGDRAAGDRDAGDLVAQAPAGGGLAAAPTALHDAWHGWWGQLVGLGLGAAEELVAAGVGLATRMEDAGLVHPGAVVRDLVAQLAHQAARDAEVSPARLVGLAGELEARLRSLGRPGGVPAALVAGVPDAEQPVGVQRLVGLGAEHLHVGGWSRLRVYLGDVRSGAVRTLTVEGTDTEETPVTAQRLGARTRAGSTYAAWAAAAAVLPRSRRRGAELVLPRGTAPVRRSATWAVPEDSPLLAARLDAVAVGVDVPGPLAPRGSAAGVGAVRVASVEDVRHDPLEARLTATVTDEVGVTARLELPVSTRALPGAEATAERLASGGTTAVAGRWVRRADGLVVRPTLLDGEGGPLVVPLGVPQASGPDGSASGEAPPSTDPWQRLTGDVTETVGRLLVLGARRGAAGLRSDLADHAARAERLGLLRWAGALRAAAGDDLDPVALLDLAVLLEMAR
ncbi:hypothetical protein QE364_000619 [Nocardioides zeae]|uniref:Uncharacterized protein n=1 Tax=Nocardioides zeae TaxID=1457234 RepID=A0ACC6IEJ7_9ACTN|nr:hypothetical protein [Nocardioides zeae]MDR6174120.1 hypothetical protein [Nocardioides zeae]MDR6208927.1 hypothetical protein [Nocardioides zeae]